MKKIKIRKPKRLTRGELEKKLHRLFDRKPYDTFSLRDIFHHLRLESHPQKMFTISIVEGMTAEGALERVSENSFRLSEAYLKARRQKKATRRARRYGVVGERLDDNTVMNAILEEFGLPYSYPQTVEKAAEKIDATITEKDLREREDFRNVTTFTIDPKDAKDFDDALSIRQIDDKRWEVGVHIADVTHYVTPDSIIESEAQKRATSIYLVDRTIPMLPERLCNFICSLRPDEEKLTYSVIFTLNADAEVEDWRLVHAIIKSNRRFAYEEVQEILEGSDGDYAEELRTLDSLAKKLRALRFKNGAIKFRSEELKFDVDEEGHPVNAYYKVSTDATELIEEFMLLANRTVAESIGKVRRGQTKKVLPYRIHESPDEEKMDQLRDFIVRFGYKLKTAGSKGQQARNLNKLMEECEGHGEQKLIERLALRAMMKAKYSTINIGHFGLAFDYYTHFTSPIRRYPDMMVHRLLTHYQNGGKSGDREYYEMQCEHSSEMEILSVQAERASVKYKATEFLAGKIGVEFDAHITGITEYGVYCEIDENHCEGMVSLKELDDDYYQFDEKNFCLVGQRTGRKLTLGDAVRVVVIRANLEKRLIDFSFVKIS